jgi:Uma2 family endonuclease
MPALTLIFPLVLPEAYHLPLKLNVHDTKLTEEQFVRLCRENPDLQIELTAQGTWELCCQQEWNQGDAIAGLPVA